MRAVLQKLERSRRLAQADAEGVLDLWTRQPEDAPRGGSGGERSARRRGVEAPVVVVRGPEGHAEAAGDLHAAHDPRQDVPAGGAAHLRRGQGGGDHGGAGVEGPGGVGVVEVQAMTQRAVQEGRRRGRVPLRIPDDARAPAREPQGPNGLEEGRGGVGVVTGTERDAHQVQHQQLSAPRHLGRDVVQGEVGGEIGQFLCYVDHGSPSGVVRTIW